MFSDIVSDFEQTTRFGLLDFFEQYRDFMQDGFPAISAYYSGETSKLDAEHTKTFESLKKQGKVLMNQFINFSNRLGNCGFWELQTYCQDLLDTLEKIDKLPKYYRTSKTVRGYQPYVQATGLIGGKKTLEDLADEINSDGVSEISLIIDNDLQEKDWEIDELSTVTAFVNNETDVVVDTILETPVGDNVYGRDIKRKITLKDNDLVLVEYKRNVDQKVDILLELERGDIPEKPNFGKARLQGTAIGTYNYAELIKDLQDVFNQDALFDNIEVQDVTFSQGSLIVRCNVNTVYGYSTTKSVSL